MKTTAPPRDRVLCHLNGKDSNTIVCLDARTNELRSTVSVEAKDVDGNGMALDAVRNQIYLPTGDGVLVLDGDRFAEVGRYGVDPGLASRLACVDPVTKKLFVLAGHYEKPILFVIAIP